MVKATPMVQQYLSIKQQHPDAILFFRMGDFYEMFFEDAKIASRILEIALTSRNKKDEDPIPMCGIPYHAANAYIAPLIQNGFKVAVCEQMEDPAKAKGLVRRDVVRVITPGVLLDTEILDAKRNNFLMALYFWRNRYGIAHLDISTGTFKVTESSQEEAVLDECRRIEPKETLVAESLRDDRKIKALIESLDQTSVNFLKDDIFDPGSAQRRLLRQFKTQSLEGFGCHGWQAGIAAAGAILRYVDETHKGELVHLTRIVSYSLSDFMVIDETTKKSLELFETMRTRTKQGSLLGTMDYTVTAMGGRMLREWLQYPLVDVEPIQQRLEAVEEAKEKLPRPSLRKVLGEIHDLERLNGKIALDRCHARDLVALKNSIQRLPFVRSFIEGGSTGALFSKIMGQWDDLADIGHCIEEALCDEPPLALKEGGLIRAGFDEGLDELIRVSQEGKDCISRL
jgi:DNA mismatch repair protein MutS